MDEWINAIGIDGNVLKYSMTDDEKILFCHCPFCNFINIYDSDRLLFTVKGKDFIYSIIKDDIINPAKELTCYRCKTIYTITLNKYIVIDNTKIMEKMNEQKIRKSRLDGIINCNLAELAKMEEEEKENQRLAFIEAGKPQNIIEKMYEDVKKQEPKTNDVITKEDSETPKKYNFTFIGDKEWKKK